MRSTFCSRSAARLRASQVLENVKHADPARGNVFFQQLPTRLANFFRKYPPSPFREYAEKASLLTDPTRNPFMPNKNPVTGRWHSPTYSLRKQSDLYKIAYRFGIAHLLPKLANNKKFYEDKYHNKIPPKGSIFFKGSKSERNAEKREAQIQEALAHMDEKIYAAKPARFRKKAEAKIRPVLF